MARERVYDWPGGRLPIVRVLDDGPTVSQGRVVSGVGPMLWTEELGEQEAAPFGNGLALLQPLIVPLRNLQGEDLAELEIGVVDRQPGVVAIRARGRTRLTGTFLRELPPLRKLVPLAIRARTVRVVRYDDGRIVGERYVRAPDASIYIDEKGVAHRSGMLHEELVAELEEVNASSTRQTLTDEFLEQVAIVYRDAASQGASTQKAIQERWPTSAANARRWVAHARRRGFLGPAPNPRMAGERHEENGMHYQRGEGLNEP